MAVLVHPAFAEKLRRVKVRAKAEDILVIWRFGYRSVAYQQELLDCWNNPANNYECRKRRGIIAKPGRPGLSTHNWGSGVDFSTKPEGKHARVGQIAKEEGLRWGGEFRKNYDPVHLDDRGEFTLGQLKERFKEEDLVNL